MTDWTVSFGQTPEGTRPLVGRLGQSRCGLSGSCGRFVATRPHIISWPTIIYSVKQIQIRYLTDVQDAEQTDQGVRQEDREEGEQEEDDSEEEEEQNERKGDDVESGIDDESMELSACTDWIINRDCLSD